jgi:hypothetical protein
VTPAWRARLRKLSRLPAAEIPDAAAELLADAWDEGYKAGKQDGVVTVQVSADE